MRDHTDLADMDVDALTSGYAAGAFSPVDAAEASLARIEAFNDQVNAYCFVDAEGALAAARRSEARWRAGRPLSPIDGVPASSKDTTLVRGWTSTAGSNVFCMSAPASEDGSVAARLKQAGAVLLGLTSSPEIGWKGVTDSPRHGATLNPWNTALTPGGSSGGAAVAAALGMGVLHVGTDAGGSIRIPAAFTGVFGHKPSFGRVPNYPASAFSTLSHAGPITRSVRDGAHMLNVLARADARDWYALPPADTDYAAASEGGVGGCRVAFCPAPAGLAPDPGVAALLEDAARVFADLGAKVIETDLPLDGAREVFEAFWFASVAARLDGLRPEELAALDPGLASLGRRARGLGLVAYQKRARQRIELARNVDGFLQDYDFAILPTLPLTAFAAGRNVPEGGPFADWWDWAACCYPFNLTRLPACSLPCGQLEGLPVGLQIVGRRFDDAGVLRAARAFERLRPAPLPDRPRIPGEQKATGMAHTDETTKQLREHHGIRNL